MLNVVLGDETINAVSGSMTYGDFHSLTHIVAIAFMIHNQGPSETHSRQTEFASGPGGTGLVCPGTLYAQAVANGGIIYYPSSSLMAIYGNRFGEYQPSVVGSFRIGMRSAGTSLIRLVTLGLQDV